MVNWSTHGGFCDNQPLVESLDTLEGLYAQLALTQPKWFRLLCAWNYIAKQRDPGPAATGIPYGSFTPPQTKYRDWSSLDRCVNRILGVVKADLILVIGQGRPSYTSSSTVDADYAAFCVEVVQRYKVGGTGISPANAGKGCVAIEIWSEENVSGLWGKSVNPGKAVADRKPQDQPGYVDYLKAAYTAVKAVAPTMKIIFGGTQHVRYPTKPYFGDGWVTEQEVDFYTRCFNAEPNLGTFVDYFAIHPYNTVDADYTGWPPDDTDDSWHQADTLHTLFTDKGFGSVPTMITEVGWPTNVVTEQQQSDYHQTAMGMWAARPWISDYIVYSAWDRSSSRIEKEKFYGCLHRDLTSKPLHTWLMGQVGITLPAPTMDMTLTMAAPGLSLGVSPPTMDFPLTMSPPVVGAFVSPPVMDFPLTMLAPSIATNVAVAAPLMSFPLTMTAPVVKTAIAYSFTGTTKPAGVIDGGQNNATFVSSSIMVEGNVTSGSNGTWYSWALWPTRISTQIGRAVIIKAELDTFANNRGVGAAMFADATHGIIAPVVGLSSSVGAQIITCLAGTLVVRAQDVSLTVAENDLVEIRISLESGHLRYTVCKNSTPTGVTWLDSTDLLTPPTTGWLWGASFLRRRSGGVDYRSPGIKAWTAQDL